MNHITTEVMYDIRRTPFLYVVMVTAYYKSNTIRRSIPADMYSMQGTMCVCICDNV